MLTLKRYCKDCKGQKCLKSNKLCKKIEQLFRKKGIHSANWIRPENPKSLRDTRGRWKEAPFSQYIYEQFRKKT